MIAALLCFVIGITDGDTIKARCGAPGAYQQVTVRLAAIDAPERRQPFGEVSRQHLAALCFNQPAIRCTAYVALIVLTNPQANEKILRQIYQKLRETQCKGRW